LSINGKIKEYACQLFTVFITFGSSLSSESWDFGYSHYKLLFILLPTLRQNTIGTFLSIYLLELGLAIMSLKELLGHAHIYKPLLFICMWPTQVGHLI